jgi:hypothetical protein
LTATWAPSGGFCEFMRPALSPLWIEHKRNAHGSV